MCHTDLHYREGGISDDFPFLLGHEAAGIVEAVGPDVTGVAPGDFVVLNWRAVCGECRACRRGRPQYCFATHNATQKMTLEDGTRAVARARHRRVRGEDARRRRSGDEGRTRRRARRPRACSGCGVMAGFGAAKYTGDVGRGDTVAVFGCGGVGDAAIASARLAGARTIIAVDLDPKKLEWAKEFGATHTVDASKEDPVARIQELHRRATAPTCASRPSAGPRC